MSRTSGISRPLRMAAVTLTAAAALASVVGTTAGAQTETSNCQISTPSGQFAEDVRQSAASAQVWRLYQSIYLRQPKRSGFDYWVGVRESGASMADIAKLFITDSAEFENRYGDVSNRQFVNLVFKNVLCREPVDTGLNYWTTRLQRGTSQADVLLNFTELHEYMRTTGTCFSASGVPQDELDHCDPDYQDRLLEQEVVDLTNQRRLEAGCDPVGSNARLNRAALAHSVDMSDNDYFDHFGLDDSNPGDRIARTGYDATGWAENIAWGYRTADAVMAGWMNSSGHRANILNCSLQEIGVGFHNRFWTQKFAIPR